MRATPFLKWAGGKRQLLASILERTPREISGTYWEPFVGGGAVFFALAGEGRIQRAVLADANHGLIETYGCVRDRPDELIAALGAHRNDEAHFYAVRALDPASLSSVERAARFIFLNKCGYNGLYRVNSKGRFNVPFGRYVNPTICDADGLRAASQVLQIAELRCGDFDLARAANSGDFVYFDPPYVPLSKTSFFTAYVAGGFGPKDQDRLRELALSLKERNVKLLLSNSSNDEVRAMYAQGFELESVAARRLVNCQVSGRGTIAELLIY